MVAREDYTYNVLKLVPLFSVDRPVILVEVLHHLCPHCCCCVVFILQCMCVFSYPLKTNILMPSYPIPGTLFFLSHEINIYCIYMKINRCLNSSVQVENNLLKNSAQATTTGKRHAFASHRAPRYSRLGGSVCANGVAAGGACDTGSCGTVVACR